MNEHETIKDVTPPTVTVESRPITDNPAPSSDSLPHDNIVDKNELTRIVPAENDCPKEVQESSNDQDTQPQSAGQSESLTENGKSVVKGDSELADNLSTEKNFKENNVSSSEITKSERASQNDEPLSENGPPNEELFDESKLIENNQNVLQKSSTESTTNALKESPKEPKESPRESEATQSGEEYAEHVTYTDDGIAIYTDPKTKYKYKWCDSKSNWVSFEEETNPTANGDSSQKSNPYENEHYRWCTETNQWIPKTTTQASSQTETEHYRWDAEKNEWILKSQVSLDNVTYGYEDGVRTYTDKDGAVFFWDTEKKAWFPKIDDDFMARYQMSYGFIDNTSVSAPVKEEVKKIEPVTVEEVKKADVPVGGVKRKAPAEPPKWFEVDPTQNTKVYVSNLPLDITLEEFAEIMSKCGMIMRDPQTQKQKLKLYTEADGQIKGDGLCDYIKVESVDLALELLDESIVRGNKIKVQRAKFQMRGEYNPTLKPKRSKKDKEKLLKMKTKLFDWRPEKMRGERAKHEKIVIIKNLFTPELFDKEVHLIIDYQNDLREECSKCGTVRKVVIFDRHAEGIAQVNMADADQADLVVQMMNGRYFGQRKLIAEIWDGKTKYKVAETEKEIEERINKWDKYLETEEENAEKEKERVANAASTKPTIDVTKMNTEEVPSV